MSSVDLTKLGANQLKNTTSGEMVEVGSLWREQTVVLFFLRRFGCQVCRWLAAEVSKLEKDLKANGVALVGVGPEDLGVKEFKDGGFLKGEIYIDEKKQCYKDLGFKRYNAINIVPAAMGKKVREIASKASAEGIQGNFSGDLLQSGGMLIVAKGGEEVLMHFVQNTPGDNASLEDIAKALGISVSVQAGERPQIFIFDATSRLLVLDRAGVQSVMMMFAQDRRFSDLQVMIEELNIMMDDDQDLLMKMNAFF